MRVGIAGTFNVLHEGHKLLIDNGIKKAGEKGTLSIGLTTGEITKTKKIVKPFKERKKAIQNYIIKKKKVPIIEIIPINNKYGPIIEEDYDAIVVSPETRITAEEINKKRKKIGKKPLDIVQIPFVLAEDGKPISSSRILSKEINKKGEIIKHNNK
jgi:pantetheine-phosphate adenylyltransferase